MGLIFSPYRRLLQFVDASWKRQWFLASLLVFTWEGFYFSFYNMSYADSYPSLFLLNVNKTMNDFFRQLWQLLYESAELIFVNLKPGEFGDPEDSLWKAIVSALFFSLFFLGGVIMATAVSVCCLLGLLFVILLPFGPSTVLASISAEVSVEPVPRGVWLVHQFCGDACIHESLTSLAHSASYDDPRVISLLASWIKGEGRKLNSPT